MQKKYRLLFWGILLDGVGLLSFVIPFFGEFFDVVWAPISAFIIFRMYKGTTGKLGGLVSFIEEIGILGTDFIPTFTLTWIYNYLIKKSKIT
ncbi:MAG: hypothetical protein WC389_13640 [Lutibacter sp.]|jgi:hypothetical protein